MTRETDVALAGDDYPELGCEGDPFRDVNGDGQGGFGPDVPESTRTRDELSPTSTSSTWRAPTSS